MLLSQMINIDTSTGQHLFDDTFSKQTECTTATSRSRQPASRLDDVVFRLGQQPARYAGIGLQLLVLQCPISSTLIKRR